MIPTIIQITLTPEQAESLKALPELIEQFKQALQTLLPKAKENTPTMLNIKQAAEYAGVSIPTMRRIIEKGEISVVRVCDKPKIITAELQEYLLNKNK
jgi:excisionase family DNA binding protein